MATAEHGSSRPPWNRATPTVLRAPLGGPRCRKARSVWWDQSDVAEPHSEHHKEDHKEDGQGSHHAGHVHGEQRAEDEVPRWKVVWNGAGATRAARACGGRRVPAGLIAARAHAACGMRML